VRLQGLPHLQGDGAPVDRLVAQARRRHIEQLWRCLEGGRSRQAGRARGAHGGVKAHTPSCVAPSSSPRGLEGEDRPAAGPPQTRRARRWPPLLCGSTLGQHQTPLECFFLNQPSTTPPLVLEHSQGCGQGIGAGHFGACACMQACMPFTHTPGCVNRPRFFFCLRARSAARGAHLLLRAAEHQVSSRAELLAAWRPVRPAYPARTHLAGELVAEHGCRCWRTGPCLMKTMQGGWRAGELGQG